MAGDEQKICSYGDGDDQQTEQSRCIYPPLDEQTQPSINTETQQQQQQPNAVVVVVVDAAATEQKKKVAAANADGSNDADLMDLEAAFPPELNRVYRVPGAYREGGDNSSPLIHPNDDFDDADLNSTSRTRRMMHQNQQQQAQTETGASPRLDPVAETLVSATLVTEDSLRHASAEFSLYASHQLPTATATAVYGVPQSLPSENSNEYVHSQLPSVMSPESPRRSRKSRLVRTACLVGVVALVVGLSLALVTVVSSDSNSSSNSSTDMTNVSAEGKELDPATQTTVLVNDDNGVAVDVPEEDVMYSPALPRQIQYAVTWGTASTCDEIMGNGVTLELQCGGTGSQGVSSIDIGLELVGAANAACQRQTATEMTCRLDASENPDAALNRAAAAVVFTCTVGPAESLAVQLLQLQAVAMVSDTMASQCAAVLQEGVADATTGQQTTFHGGKTVSYASLGRYCRRDSVTVIEEQTATGYWQVEAELSTCQVHSRTVATKTSATVTNTDGNNSSLEQEYCYDAATCAVESTCVPVTRSGDNNDDYDHDDNAEIHIEDDESSGSGSGTLQTVVQDLVCVGSKQCTSLLEPIVLAAPEGSSRCATVVGQQDGVLSVEQLSTMARAELVGTRDLFLQQFG